MFDRSIKKGVCVSVFMEELLWEVILTLAVKLLLLFSVSEPVGISSQMLEKLLGVLCT